MGTSCHLTKYLVKEENKQQPNEVYLVKAANG